MYQLRLTNTQFGISKPFVFHFEVEKRRTEVTLNLNLLLYQLRPLKSSDSKMLCSSYKYEKSNLLPKASITLSEISIRSPKMDFEFN